MWTNKSKSKPRRRDRNSGSSSQEGDHDDSNSSPCPVGNSSLSSTASSSSNRSTPPSVRFASNMGAGNSPGDPSFSPLPPFQTPPSYSPEKHHIRGSSSSYDTETTAASTPSPSVSSVPSTAPTTAPTPPDGTSSLHREIFPATPGHEGDDEKSSPASPRMRRNRVLFQNDDDDDDEDDEIIRTNAREDHWRSLPNLPGRVHARESPPPPPRPQQFPERRRQRSAPSGRTPPQGHVRRVSSPYNSQEEHLSSNQSLNTARQRQASFKKNERRRSNSSGGPSLGNRYSGIPQSRLSPQPSMQHDDFNKQKKRIGEYDDNGTPITMSSSGDRSSSESSPERNSPSKEKFMASVRHKRNPSRHGGQPPRAISKASSLHPSANSSFKPLSPIMSPISSPVSMMDQDLPGSRCLSFAQKLRIRTVLVVGLGFLGIMTVGMTLMANQRLFSAKTPVRAGKTGGVTSKDNHLRLEAMDTRNTKGIAKAVKPTRDTTDAHKKVVGVKRTAGGLRPALSTGQKVGTSSLRDHGSGKEVKKEEKKVRSGKEEEHSKKDSTTKKGIGEKESAKKGDAKDAHHKSAKTEKKGEKEKKKDDKGRDGQRHGDSHKKTAKAADQKVDREKETPAKVATTVDVHTVHTPFVPASHTVSDPFASAWSRAKGFGTLNDAFYGDHIGSDEGNRPRVFHLDGAAQPRHRKVELYPAEFSDNTQLYSVLDSNDAALSKMEIRPPYASGECVPMKEWQTTFHPSCNGMHELDLRRHHHQDSGGDVELFGTKGYWRNAWKIDVAGDKRTVDERDEVVLKTLKYQHNFEDAHFEHDRVDAVAMERLTSSPHVINIFGFCGHSVITEYADGQRVGTLADKSKKKPLARLKIARDIAEGLADVHSIDGENNATFVHLDVNPANVVSIGGTLKLNDFNIGIILKWNTTSQTQCGFPAQYPNPQWRSPEEANESQHLTEKVDVFSMGHIFFRMICGHEPWNKLEPGGRPSKDEVHERVKKGKLPYIPEEVTKTSDEEVAVIRDAMLDCYTFDPKKRPSARAIAKRLNEALTKLSK